METAFKRCTNCGNYFLTEKSEAEELFCSIDCEVKFIRCSVCGEFYENETGTTDEANFVCSDDCKKKYKVNIKKDKYELDFSKLK